MRILFLYDENDPLNGSVGPGSLPNVDSAWRSAQSLVLIERGVQASNAEKTRKLEFRNSGVELPYDDDTLIWCKFFKLDKMERKNHVIKVSLHSTKLHIYKTVVFHLNLYSSNPFLIQRGAFSTYNT